MLSSFYKLQNLTIKDPIRVLYTNTDKLSQTGWLSFSLTADISKYNYIAFFHSDSLSPESVGAYDNFTSFVPIEYFKKRNVGISDIPYSSHFTVGFRYKSSTDIYIQVSRNPNTTDNNGIEVWVM